MSLKPIIILPLVLVLFLNCTTREKNSTYKSTMLTVEGLIQKSYKTKFDPADRLAYLDTAQTLLRTANANTDSLEIAIIYSKGLIHLSRSQIDSFYLANTLLAKKAEQNDNLFFLGRAQFNLGYYFDELTNKPDSAFTYYRQSKNSHLRNGNIKEMNNAIINIAVLQGIQNDFFGAKETLTEAIKNSVENQSLTSIYNELATNNRKLQNFTEALKYYRLAIKNAGSIKQSIKYKNNLAALFTEMKDFEKAFIIFEELLQEKALAKESTTYARILDNYTYAKLKNGERDLEHFFYEALQLRKKFNDKRGQIASYTHLGEYFTRSDPRRATKYLDSVILLSNELNTPKAETDALALLLNLEPKNIAFRDRYIFLKDSMYNNELKVKTQFAKMKYDDEREKEQILELETETAQKRAELAEQKAQKVILLSLSGFLLLGGASFLYFLRQRHKKEKLQEVYNTEKRISQDLHDGLANDVFGLMTKIQSQDKAYDELLNNLEDIYQTTRQISHENAAIKTGVGFKDELNALIANYQDNDTTILVKDMSNIEWALLEEHKSVIVHRSIKELLVNMKKHSLANLVSLQFKNQKSKIIISYSDNGVGFNPKKSRGIGLMNTENRIHSIGGGIIFETKQGSGAKVTIAIPF